ncbi:MAG: dihydroorotate dehydrogenase electron transfer subunit [Spirochaetia bacterium]|jgi:dihydroorotate dehydrogenase electron transfer subunit|nr:dihydroorotate dehydrogenase electron transfer subunit [Spirochaetia bacterium]
MNEIVYNRKVNDKFYLMKVKDPSSCDMGQFVMVRTEDNFPLLSRPLGIFDSNAETTSFLYQTVGQGTQKLSTMQAGQHVLLQGPNGTGFPHAEGKIALVGGGTGIAPLYYAGKKLKEQKNTIVDGYLGFSKEAILVDQYKEILDAVTVNVGGYIIQDIDVQAYDYIYACGPTIMMKLFSQICREKGVGEKLFVSLEARMGCGIGICLGCSIKTIHGNQRVCKEGPVFKANEVFYE